MSEKPKKPVSLKRAEAARINGAGSRGPITAEGKARSATNSLRHALCARSVCLTSESRPRYEALAQDYYERFVPADTIERDLVDEMVAAKWRQRRIWALETAIFDLRMDLDEDELNQTFESLDEETRLAAAWLKLADPEGTLHVLIRYEAAQRRTFERALRTLRELRAEAVPPPRVCEFPNKPKPEPIAA